MLIQGLKRYWMIRGIFNIVYLAITYFQFIMKYILNVQYMLTLPMETLHEECTHTYVYRVYWQYF